MFRNYIKARLAVFLAVFVLPGTLLAAECLTAIDANADPTLYPENTGYATLVQVDQGQGSINCSDFIGDNGPMEPVEFPNFKVSGGVNGEGIIGTVDFPLNWETNDVSDPETFIKLVFIGNSGDGSRCTQFYTKNATAGKLGSGFKTNKASDFVACTEGDPEEIPEPIVPPTPPDLTEAGCPDDFQNVINIKDDEWDVMILSGSPKGVGGEGRSALCIDQTLNGGDPNDPNPPALNRCANRCIVPDAANDPNWIPFDDPEREPGGNCTETGPSFIATGRFPIACRVCELSSIVQSDFFEPDLQFCWEQGQDVQPAIQPSQPTGDFKLPPPDQGNQGWDVNGKFGSTCYLISGKTRSGYPYSYWAPSGCPN